MRKKAEKGLFTGALALFAACAAFLFLADAALAGAKEGAKVFAAKKCGACHQTQGPAREKAIKDVLAKKGPELWYAGSKFREGFLEAWLREPAPIRPMEYYSLTKRNGGGHPGLSVAEAKDVAEYLMGLKSPEAGGHGVRPGDNPKGRIVFVKKQSCYGCHQVRERGAVTGGFTGPSLAGASARLQADWVYAYLSNPKVFKPVKDMPDYAGILTDEELRAVAAYVAGLK